MSERIGRPRRLIVALAAGSIASFSAAATATAAPARNRVVGGGRDAFDANISVSAHSGPSGASSHGHINATLPSPGTPGDTFHVRLEVVCVAVVGNLAAVGGVVTTSSANDLPPGTQFVVVFRDTGMPGGDGDASRPIFGAPALACANFVPLAATAPPMRNGNITIQGA